MQIVGAAIIVAVFIGIFVMMCRMATVRVAAAIFGSAFGVAAVIVVAVIWMCGFTVSQFVQSLSGGLK